MLTCRDGDGHPTETARGGGGGDAGCRWYDLCDPAPEEIAQVEQATGLKLPTRERIHSIEMSNRAAVDGDVLRLNVPFFAQADDEPHTPLGLVVAPAFLVSLRYDGAALFSQAVETMLAATPARDGAALFAALVQALVGHTADRLEKTIAATGELSTRVLCHPKRSTRLLNDMLGEIGRIESRLTRARQTLAGLVRIVGYVRENAPPWIGKAEIAALKLSQKDLDTLGELDGQMTDKLQFLLDAVLGFINIDQNEVMKILTVASVVSTPPMILAGIWGMNFVAMPELKQPWGYPMALALIVLSAVLPFVWFKRRGWL